MISFPASPSSGQQYSEGGTTWEYNGTVWNVIAETTGEQTVDNIQVGVTTDNTIDTSTGDLVLGASGNVVLAADLVTTGYKINSSYELPGADGTAGQVLRTNGSGAVSFQTPSKLFENIRIGVSSNTTIDTSSGTLILDSAAGGITVSTNLNITGTFAPIISNIYSLGSTTNTWANVYSNSIYANNISTLTAGAALNINGSYSFPATDGTAGQVLVTNGLGVLTFGNPSNTFGNIEIGVGDDQNFIRGTAGSDLDLVIQPDGDNIWFVANGLVGVDGNLTVTGAVTISNMTQVNNTLTVTGNTTTANIVPDADLSRNLGSSTERWSQIFAGEIRTTDVMAGNLKIGIVDGNTIDTTTGNLELDSASGMTFVIDDLYVTGSIDFLGTLSQNGNMVDTGNPDPRIVRQESGTDVTYTFN